jgi:hypothetical protein
MRRFCFAIVLVTGVLATQVGAQDIGLTALRDRVGLANSNGAGVSVMHTEALEGANVYMPNTADPDFAGKTFTDGSGTTSGTPSNHATGVGRIFYGIGFGVAPGITNIHSFKVVGNLEPGDWFGEAYLNFGGAAPLARPDLRVQNHSWIGTGAFTAAAQEATRRYDFALSRDNVLGVVGVNNGVSPIPPFMGHTYNGIAVGRSDGISSVGPTLGDVAGRSKPDIVAPSGSTSGATPMVSGAGAILIQTANQLGSANANRIETLKSTLLTGATKDEFLGLGQPWTRLNNGTFVEPLDRRFGAGELNVNNSHLVLTAGEKDGTDLVLDGSRGWDLVTMTGEGTNRRYFFDVPDLQNMRLSATATWLRRITPTGGGANVFATSDATLSLVELRLFEANPDFSLGALVDSSISPIDNVQHIFQLNLPGNRRYAVEILLADLPGSQASEDVAISWFTDLSAVPEPGTYALFAFAGAAGVVWYARRQRKLSGLESLEVECVPDPRT